MPDLFDEGDEADKSWFPVDPEENKADLDNFPGVTNALRQLDGFESVPAVAAQDSASKRKAKAKAPPPQEPPTRRPKGETAPTIFGDLSSSLDARRNATAAEAQDASIYDYDGVYDSLKLAGQKSKASEDADGAKRPKYFGSIQRAAEVRERDRLIAEEKRLKRERDAEGAEFADKEKFVTEAYKRQQEENRRLEELEKRREEEDVKRNKGKGLQDFYKKMLTREEELHAAKMRAAEEARAAGWPSPAEGAAAEDEAKTDAELAREINEKGGAVIINDDGEVVDKRQLLKGGLNVSSRKAAEIQREKARQAASSSDNAGAAWKSKGVYAPGGKQAMRERQTRMLEAQLEETLKRSREEEEDEKAKVELVSKSCKTGAEISSAKERYLARKRAAEEAKKNGLAKAP
ncbi:hypothetical protein P8C59_004690 [Phyllachora maydis]|uniref:Nuclear speckle splicing regulatory protein 1 N-terminal domain-containing protein n=1 Tax=Phyllachora maydis TaxID=1825666 RepID=A0AAD9MEP6_9PEZI|nr:hypothetical protein P8C59_004690 [Phyllachora maydis]